MSQVRGAWVRELRPPTAEPLGPVSFPESVAAATALLGAGPVAWAVHTAREMALRNVARLPALGTSEYAVDLVRLGAEPSMIACLVGIHDGALAPSGLAPEVATQLRDYVRRGIPLERSWEAIHTGHEWMAGYLMAACRTLVEPAGMPDQLELVSRILFAYVNPLTTAVGELYTAELREWERNGFRARSEMVNALLMGEPVPDADVSATLQYTVAHRFHTGLVVWRDDMDPRGSEDLSQLAQTTLTMLGATSTLAVPVGRFELWAWGASVRAPAADGEVSAEGVLPEGVRIAVGLAATGADGFRSTHHQATRAARVNRLLGDRADQVTAFADVGLLSLLSSDLDEAHGFLQQELQELAGIGQANADLRETLLTYLESHRSPQAAAARLYVARNTVTYRVKRAETLIGHSLNERETEVRNALLLARLLLGDHSTPVSDSSAKTPKTRNCTVPRRATR